MGSYLVATTIALPFSASFSLPLPTAVRANYAHLQISLLPFLSPVPKRETTIDRHISSEMVWEFLHVDPQEIAEEEKDCQGDSEGPVDP